MVIGEIVETLIRIRDKYRGDWHIEELEALNEACNVLDRRFNRFDDSYDLRNDHITSVHWMEEDIKKALVEDGFEASNENISQVLNYPGLGKYLQERGIEAGWAVIHNTISDVKSNLTTPKED